MSLEQEIKVPDIGGAANVDVIEILVKEGDTITKDSSLVTLESDKASMEIPSPVSGIVKSLRIKLGDKVSEGDVILIASLEQSVEEKKSESVSIEAAAQSLQPLPEKHSEKIEAPSIAKPDVPAPSETSSPVGGEVFAGPAVRRLAHQLGVNLAEVTGSGRKARISKEDVEAYVKQRLAEPRGGLAVTPMSTIDFSQFGEIEKKPLNKIKRLTGVNVHRSWVTIPHVTQFDEADITELEAFRVQENQSAQANGYKLTILAFVCKVVSKALSVYPSFNASLDERAEHLIYKKYVNIGIAVETPNGLVVPVIRDVNRLSVGEIALEMARLSKKAREKGLMPNDMSGGCFTISSLGGIGGTAFTPIVNAPEVAILGLSKSVIKPVYQNGSFEPRLMLPLSLSYDHRVIDGAEAARFTRFIGECLNDVRRILL